MTSREYRSNDIDGLTADFAVIGGGPAGIASADALSETGASVIAITSGSEFGGLADRSAEQIRLLQANEPYAWMADSTMRACIEIEQSTGGRTIDKFPYVFLIGSTDQDKADRRNFADYVSMVQSMKGWGYDPNAEFFDTDQLDQLRKRYPFLDGKDITGAVLVHNAGRIQFDSLRAELQRRSASNVRYAAGVRAGRIIIGRGDRVIGVETDKGKISTENVVLAPGAHVVNISRLFADSNIQTAAEEFESRFTVTQRELFAASLPGLPLNPDAGTVFVVSPDGAWVRVEQDKTTGDAYGTFGYAGPNDAVVRQPVENPQPLKDHERWVPFAAEVYDLLGGNISLLDKRPPRPIGTSAGYYAAYKDHKPTIGGFPAGEVAGDTIPGVALAAGGDGEGVMTMMGVGRIVREYFTEEQRVPKAIMDEVNPCRRINDGALAEALRL